MSRPDARATLLGLRNEIELACDVGMRLNLPASEIVARIRQALANHPMPNPTATIARGTPSSPDLTYGRKALDALARGFAAEPVASTDTPRGANDR